MQSKRDAIERDIFFIFFFLLTGKGDGGVGVGRLGVGGGWGGGAFFPSPEYRCFNDIEHLIPDLT